MTISMVCTESKWVPSTQYSLAWSMTYCSSTPTKVRRTRHNITLYARFLLCYHYSANTQEVNIRSNYVSKATFYDKEKKLTTALFLS